MKNFVKLSSSSFSFSSCNICDAACCDGTKNILYSQIILKDFKEISDNFPILFIFGEMGFLKPVFILTNGKKFCKYIKKSRCTIYENRPSICRVYPLSANIDDEVYIDCSCPAISNGNRENIDNKEIIKEFDNHILKNYQDKYIDTHLQFDKYNRKDNIDLALIINGVKFYKINKNFDDEYLKIHHKSLKHLNDKYFKF